MVPINDAKFCIVKKVKGTKFELVIINDANFVLITSYSSTFLLINPSDLRINAKFVFMTIDRCKKCFGYKVINTKFELVIVIDTKFGLLSVQNLH